MKRVTKLDEPFLTRERTRDVLNAVDLYYRDHANRAWATAMANGQVKSACSCKPCGLVRPIMAAARKWMEERESRSK